MLMGHIVFTMYNNVVRYSQVKFRVINIIIYWHHASVLLSLLSQNAMHIKNTGGFNILVNFRMFAIKSTVDNTGNIKPHKDIFYC